MWCIYICRTEAFVGQPIKLRNQSLIRFSIQIAIGPSYFTAQLQRQRCTNYDSTYASAIYKAAIWHLIHANHQRICIFLARRGLP